MLPEVTVRRLLVADLIFKLLKQAKLLLLRHGLKFIE